MDVIIKLSSDEAKRLLMNLQFAIPLCDPLVKKVANQVLMQAHPLAERQEIAEKYRKHVRKPKH